MTGEERRREIIRIIRESRDAVSGTGLAGMLHVSRQVIVQDIALLRAADYPIVSTTKGYILNEAKSVSRVFKVFHTDEQTEDELNCIVDMGGFVADVFVDHKVYGKLCAKLSVGSRRDVRNFMEELRSGKAAPLKKLTSDIHYHTVEAGNTQILAANEQEFKEQDYLRRNKMLFGI